MPGQGRSKSSELFTDTELAGGRPPSEVKARIAERANEKEVEAKLAALAVKYGILDEEDLEEEERKIDIVNFTVLHRLILALYMQGKSQANIARELGCHYLTVHKLLHSPKAQEILARWKETLEMELEGLLPSAINAVRLGLESPDRKIQLLAVDRFVKLTKDDPQRSAVTVNVVNSARTRFITGLKDLVVEVDNVEDVEYEEVADI